MWLIFLIIFALAFSLTYFITTKKTKTSRKNKTWDKNEENTVIHFNNSVKQKNDDDSSNVPVRVIYVRGENNNIETNNQVKRYTKKSLMSVCESHFYEILKKHFSDKYIIQPQVSLSSIIKKEKFYKNEYQNELNRVVDFLILDKNYVPLLIIEINDKTHLQKKRIERDKKVHAICDNADIKIITFWTSYNNDEHYVVNRIKKELS